MGIPAKATEVPAVYKGESWANLGIDVDNDFKALYVVTEKAKKQVAKLKKLLKSSDGLYLATDEDREGEAIAWHLLEVLNPRYPCTEWCSTKSLKKPFKTQSCLRKN